MSKIKEITYLLQDNNDHISELRLIKLLFLIDWFSELKYNDSITNIKWNYRFFLSGDNLMNYLITLPSFSITNNLGNKRKYFSINEWTSGYLTDNEKKVVFILLKKTKNLYFNELEDFFLSTYPFTKNERNFDLDLKSLALEYNLKNNLIFKGKGL